ncbi:MAG TPA: hypothetical protein VM286_01140 [Candidatus Thermoplasmatota archaeon]|nr:hypothetical protein [Candidatus Thermoplasmatota archaeon]
MKALLAVFLLGGFLAGCVGDPAPAGTARPPAPDLDTCVAPALAIPFNRTHDHTDPAQHRFACNAQRLAWDTLREHGLANGTVVGAHAVAVHGDLLAVAVNGGGNASYDLSSGDLDGTEAHGQQGVHFFDVSDPAQLAHLSFYPKDDIALGGDRSISFAQDGKTLFLGYDSGPNGPKNGVEAIDVSDPRAPHTAGFWENPARLGIVSVEAGTVATKVPQDGYQYVFALGVGVNILRYDPGATEIGGKKVFTLVAKYVTNEQLTALDSLRPQNPDAGFALASLQGHDMAFYRQPQEEGRSFLFVAYAYDGLKVLDVTRPAAPLLVGRWIPPADTNVRHYVNSVAVELSLEQKVLVVVGAASFEPENQGIASPLWILDATGTIKGNALFQLGPDPRLMGTWRNPSHAPAGDLGLSIQFFRIEHGLLYIGHGHGGVWAVDLRTDEARTYPTAYAYAMPMPPDPVAAPAACCKGHDLKGVPMVLDVAVREGVVYTADVTQGVVAVRMGPAPGPA